MDKTVTIVIATYNERDNIQEIVKKICSQPIRLERVIVVDDNSPDGTGHIADELARAYPLTVIHRPSKNGLGTAYVTAFTAILQGQYNLKKTDLIIQMDADLSHDPERIPALINASNSYDLVLGSRYVKGGGISDWNWFRRFISRSANVYARIILKLPYRDLTGGFKCYSIKTLQSIPWTTVSSLGYNFQIESTYFAHKNMISIGEIPITFTERKRGSSKFNFGIMLESFWKIIKLRFK